MSGPVLEVESLTAGYSDVPVIRDVSLAVNSGEVVALMGPNGAGKSTTLRVTSALLGQMSGEVRYLGHTIAGRAPQRLAREGLVHVPEGRGVFFGLTVGEHFRVLASEHIDVSVAYEYFPELQALEHRAAGFLSGGEQQMLALGLALARRPRVLMVDELSLGLSPIIVQRMLPIVRRYATEAGAGVLLVEQHVRLALEVADRGYVLSHGEIALHRPAADLRGDHQLLAATYLGENPRPGSTGSEPTQM
jgi:branched-chain amino acid transport system ATP-binding protein